MSLPCVKGGGSRERDGGIGSALNKISMHELKEFVTRRKRRYNPSASLPTPLCSVASLLRKHCGCQLPLHKGAFLLLIYALSIFLTSTAFVDTEAKHR